MIPLPRRGGGGVERGGDACIALGGAVFAFTPRFVLEPTSTRAREPGQVSIGEITKRSCTLRQWGDFHVLEVSGKESTLTGKRDLSQHLRYGLISRSLMRVSDQSTSSS